MPEGCSHSSLRVQVNLCMAFVFVGVVVVFAGRLTVWSRRCGVLCASKAASTNRISPPTVAALTSQQWATLRYGAACVWALCWTCVYIHHLHTCIMHRCVGCRSRCSRASVAVVFCCLLRMTAGLVGASRHAVALEQLPREARIKCATSGDCRWFLLVSQAVLIHQPSTIFRPAHRWISLHRCPASTLASQPPCILPYLCVILRNQS